MVKNGREKLPALLKSVTGFCDKAIILDTGSTDGTQKWLIEQDILPAEYASWPFDDFGTSRTKGMEYAKGKADWLLLLDDDMRLVFNKPKEEIKSSLDPAAGCYMIKHEAPVSYWITRLVRGDQDWEYKGVTHEYLDRSYTALRLDGLVIDHQYNHGPEKFERDLRLLSADIARDPYDARTIFYLAQTLRDMRHTLPAIRYYELRARMGGWEEEVYYSMYEAARLAEDPAAMTLAYNYRPSRAEAPQWLAWYYGKKEGANWKITADYWEGIRKSTPMTKDILFVNQAAYG
jgi:glycosyltransferase involved in cell wall biosynthesis